VVGQLALQPGEERRRTSSHYTPRSLSEPIVRRTLEPLLVAMSESGEPSSDQLLSLKICDPAMGSGAFLVEACRFLGDHVVAAWEREGQVDKIASAKEDVVVHARRLVAQRCLYGVDKNPFAVSLAKLSLWLVTLARDEPFTFVDHCLRHGDSLVGLSFEQIKAFHWKPEAQMEFIEKELETCVEESVALRQQILELAGDSSPGVTRLKEQLLWDANDALARLRLVGDLVVGAFFAHGSDRDREKERIRRLDLVREWLAEGGGPPPELVELARVLRGETPVFHWWLEFPEIFHGERPDPLEAEAVNHAALMDAFVGNPPFAGKNGITATGGPHYLKWLQALHSGAHGNADLSAHFFRRADALLGAHGTIGLIATNTIGQGDTRASALQPLVAAGYEIYEAIRSLAWPVAGAAVTVSVVHLGKGNATSAACGRRLDGVVVDDINSRLRPNQERPDPVTLEVNSDRRSQGSILQGPFTLTVSEANDFLANQKNAACVLPFIGGKEINTSPIQDFSRYVIDFGTRTLQEAANWPELLDYVQTHVKPQRDKLGNNAVAKQAKKLWWRFWAPRPELYAQLRNLDRCLVTAVVSKHSIFSFQPTDRIFSHQLYVFLLDKYADFALLQSRVHEHWARLLSSSHEDRLRYSASDCFDRFPFPEGHRSPCSSEDIGQRLYEARAQLMVDREQGLTTTYNQLKDFDCDDPEIEVLRRLHIEMDRAVLEAYGWVDIEPPPYTDPVTPAQRRAHEAFEDEVIDRLFALNATRAAEERILGLTTTKNGKRKKVKRPQKQEDGRRQATRSNDRRPGTSR
jgi:hypothetical protein